MNKKANRDRPESVDIARNESQRLDEQRPADRKRELIRVLLMTDERRELLVAGADFRRSWGVRR